MSHDDYKEKLRRLVEAADDIDREQAVALILSQARQEDYGGIGEFLLGEIPDDEIPDRKKRIDALMRGATITVTLPTADNPDADPAKGGGYVQTAAEHNGLRADVSAAHLFDDD